MKAKHLNYFKKRVAGRVWRVGHPIDPINVIAGHNNISKYKARQLVQELLDYSIVEKYNNKFFLMDIDFSIDVDAVQKRLIKKAKINTEQLRLLHEGAIFDKQSMAYVVPNGIRIKVFFPLRGRVADVSVLQIDDLTTELRGIINRTKLQ